MPYRAQIDDHGTITRYKDTESGELISSKEYERRMMMQQTSVSYPVPYGGQLQTVQPGTPIQYGQAPQYTGSGSPGLVPPPPAMPVGGYGGGMPQAPGMPMQAPGMPMQGGGQMSPYPGAPMSTQAPMQPMASSAPVGGPSSLVQPGAQMLNGQPNAAGNVPPPAPEAAPVPASAGEMAPPSAGQPAQEKNLRILGLPSHKNSSSIGYKTHGFLDATSIAILLPTLVLLALIIAAAHKKRLFPWQTIRTFNPPSGLMTPRDYERSHVCPPNLRRHGRLGKRDPQASWTEQDGIVLPFGFLARTHLPITIPLGRMPNKNMFLVAPSGSGKTTLMRAIIKALMAKPCVVVALEAKANDPALDEKKEGFKYTLLPEAQHAGFETLYFNPLDAESVHWNPLDLDPITFASSIVQDVNSLPPEEQHWAERDHGYLTGLVQLLKWGAVMVQGEDENGQAAETILLPCNPRGLMRLVNNRRNIVESLRRCKTNPDVPAAELSELTQMLSSIIRTDTDWDKNIQGIRGRLRMFKNPGILRCTESSNISIKESMHKPTVLIFGAPASMGPDAESLASCFVYQLQQALHTRYGTASVLPLFAFFDEYQTLNMDIAGRLSAIVRGANGGLTVILQNIGQISEGGGGASGASPELKTIFSNSAVRVCLHNADESTARFFSEEIGKHAIIVPGISDHYDSNGFGIFPTSWNRIHSQQVVQRVDADSIKRMERHHALVFTAPAGDAEFGELKPFMCDLRGIEEIARLHLLHNVASRGAEAVPGSEVAGVAPAAPGEQSPPGAKISNPVLAAMMSPKGLERAAALLGPNGPQGQAQQMASGAIATVSATLLGQGGGGGGTPPGGDRPAFPGSQAPMQPAQAMQQAAPVAQSPAGGGDRSCAQCGKWPGKGRFCIECGTFVGQPGAAAAPAAAPVAAPVAVQAPYQQPAGAYAQAAPAQDMMHSGAMPQYAQQAPPFPGGANTRPALTSLHGDMQQYGVPASPQVDHQPGQQPMRRPQPRGNGIEF